LEALLDRAGLARGTLPRFVNAGSIVAAGAFLGFIGLVRCVRAMEVTHNPFMFLLVEMFVIGAVVFIVTKLKWRAPSTRAASYLAWLNDATTSLRMDVNSGRRTSAEEIATCAAIGGLGVLAAAPIFLTISPTMFASASAPVAVSSSSCSSSSCSSSSCGGGGG